MASSASVSASSSFSALLGACSKNIEMLQTDPSSSVPLPQHLGLYAVLIAMAMAVLFLLWLSFRRKNRLYLLDYACVDYPDDQGKITSEVVAYFLPG
jgi:multisubunit Na+/H+ antiporter MnhC subunit